VGKGFRATWDRFQPSNSRGLKPRFIAQGNHVAVLWRHRAENHEIGERIVLPAAGIYRLVDELVVDSRMFHFDIAGLCQVFERQYAQLRVTASESS